MEDNNLTVYVVSDYTGKTAETVIDSVVVQFEVEKIDIERFPNISTVEELADIIDKAKEEENVIIAYTLVLPELCDYLENEAYRYNVPTMDILGPFLTRISKILDQQPQLEVGLNYKISHKAFEKMKCIDFHMRCDDGKDLNKLQEADIVLLGVSRTSKTPLSIYLSYKSYKAANISLSPEVVPPEEIYNLNPEKIIGLTIDPEVLQERRQNRLKTMEFSPQSGYAKLERIKKEIEYAEKVMNRIGCEIIDITHTTVEDVGAKILSKLEGKKIK